MATKHTCKGCGRNLREAEDQTDPEANEVGIDSIGLVSRDEWVCGRCQDSAQDRRAAERIARSQGVGR